MPWIIGRRVLVPPFGASRSMEVLWGCLIVLCVEMPWLCLSSLLWDYIAIHGPCYTCIRLRGCQHAKEGETWLWSYQVQFRIIIPNSDSCGVPFSSEWEVFSHLLATSPSNCRCNIITDGTDGTGRTGRTREKDGTGRTRWTARTVMTELDRRAVFQHVCMRH